MFPFVLRWICPYCVPFYRPFCRSQNTYTCDLLLSFIHTSASATTSKFLFFRPFLFEFFHAMFGDDFTHSTHETVLSSSSHSVNVYQQRMITFLPVTPPHSALASSSLFFSPSFKPHWVGKITAECQYPVFSVKSAYSSHQTSLGKEERKKKKEEREKKETKATLAKTVLFEVTFERYVVLSVGAWVTSWLADKKQKERDIEKQKKKDWKSKQYYLCGFKRKTIPE